MRVCIYLDVFKSVLPLVRPIAAIQQAGPMMDLRYEMIDTRRNCIAKVRLGLLTLPVPIEGCCRKLKMEASTDTPTRSAP
jgi:hypothetical protein